MELIKKTVLQRLTTGSTTGGTVIIPDLGAVYYFKIGLKSIVEDIGFFDAYVETEIPEPPIPPEITYYYTDSDDVIFVDSDNVPFVWE